MGIWDDIKMGFGAEPKTQDFRDRTAATMARNSRNSEAMRGMGQRAQDANAQRVSDRYMSQTSNGGGGGILGSLFGKDPRDRDRSTFRNPGKQEGIFGYEGFLRPKTGNAFQDLNRFMPMGLIAGAINAATTKPVDSGASYTMNTQRGVGPGTGTGTAPRPSPQQRLSGYAAPQVGTSYLNDQPPETPMTSMNPLNFRWDLNIGQTREQPSNNRRTPENPTGVMNISQPDSAFAGVPPSQRSELEPLLPASVNSPIAGFPTADGVVSVEDAAFQEWLGTEGNSKAIQQWEATNPGFARRMFDRSQFLKRGGGVNSEGNM